MKQYLNEIICYFRDFLETDFKKGRLPKRRIENIKRKKGNIIKTCVNCENYDNLFIDIFNFIKNVFSKKQKNDDFEILSDDENDCLKISTIKYQFKNAELNLIINEINKFQFELTNDDKIKLQDILVNLKKFKISLDDETDFESNIDDNLKKIIEDFILNNLCANFFNLIKDINGVYFEKKSDLLKKISFEYIIDCVSEKKEFKEKKLKNKYLDFFKNEAKSFFMLVADMFEYEKLLYDDNGEFYIYIYDITINKYSFPLFYIPINISFSSSMKNIVLKVGDKIFLNKKAIFYVFKTVNKNCSFIKKRFFDISSDSISEINDIIFKILIEFNQKALIDKISFLNNSNAYSFTFYVNDYILKIDNHIHFALFDKSDEFIVNDYEEILESKNLQNDFESIINEYLSSKKNEKNITDIVNKDFDNLSPSKKIFYNSPINLSSEQQKILMALNKSDVKTLIVEGPPGTGKSHTIVSIIANYILNNKTVLVLSDKNEALEVIEEKLNDIINSVENDKNIYNPILRVGLKNNFHNIIKKSNIELIKDEIYGICSNKNDDIKSNLSLFLKDYDRYLTSIADFRKNQFGYNILSIKILQNYLYLNKINNKIIYNNLFCIILKNKFEINFNLIKKNISEYFSNIKNYIDRKNCGINKIINSKNNILSELKIKIQNSYNNYNKAKKNYNKEYINKIRFEKNNILNKKQNNRELFDNLCNKIIEIVKILEKSFNNIDSFYLENKKLLDIFIEVNMILEKNYEFYKDFSKNIFILKQLDTIENSSFTKGVLSKINIEIYKKLIEFTNFYYDLSIFDKLFKKRKKIKEYNKYFFEKLNINKISSNFNKVNKIKIFIENLFQRITITNNINSEYLFKILNIYGIYDISKINIPENNIDVMENLKNINDVLNNNNFNFQIDNIFNIDNIYNVLESLKVLISKLKYIISINFDDIYNILDGAIKNNDVEIIDSNIAKIIKNTKYLNNDFLKLSLKEKIYNNFYNKNYIKIIKKLLISINEYNILLNKDKTLKYIKKIFISIKYEDNVLKEASKIFILLPNLLDEKNKFYSEIKKFDNFENNKNKNDSKKMMSALKMQINNNIDFIKNFKHIKLFNIKEKLETISKKTICYKLFFKIKDMYCDLRNSGNIRYAKSLLKKKMDTETLNSFLEYFPCIIASLRDYSNIIPLDKDIFDLVIIDEASQVNIAQAFPTLIRGKKILILGDRKQFSNIKSNMAGKGANSEYIAKINACFKEEFGVYNEKFKIFNIKNSVLDFIEDSRPDFSIQLKTHFRGYGELISFSNKYFYNNKLQTLKIRKKKLDEIIKFEFINDTYYNNNENDKNTNQLEIDFIVKKLEEYENKYKDIDKKPTIGIISPFTDQVLLMSRQINNHKDAETFYNDFKLKLMTFDTCQGEERDIIFYSMVATKENDKLNYIFPADIRTINNFDNDEESNLKVQRLNVGFSRVKELAYFVLSKSIDQFSGTIKVALEHFHNEMVKNDTMLETTDKKSPMEEKIKNYILATKFYKDNKNNIFFKAQFPVGEYLKQIDLTYNHPNYIVDFLISIKTKNGYKNIVIEYDGFNYHFDKTANKYNYCLLQKEEDIIRQNILENYGYIFLRLNKFNLNGINQVDFINDELYSLFDKEEFI